MDIENLSDIISTKYPQLRVTPNTGGKFGKMCLLNTNGDTLLIDNLKERYLHVINKNCIAYNENNKLKIVDSVGNVLKDTNGEIYRKKDYSPYVVIKEGREVPVIYSADLKAVLAPSQEFVDYIAEHKVMWIKEGENNYLLDENLKKINTLGAENIFYLNDNTGVVFNYSSSCKKYILATKEWKDYDFIIRKRFTNSNFYMVAQDSMRGSYDMNNDKMIIPIKYKALFTGNKELTMAYKKAGKNMYETHGKRMPYTAYNNKGKVVFQDSTYKFDIVPGQGIIKPVSKGVYELLDLDGTVINPEIKSTKVSMTKDDDFIQVADGKLNKYYIKSDFKNLEKAQAYDEIGEKMYLKDKKISIYPVSKNAKWGMIDAYGNVLYPFELEAISTKQHLEYLSIKKDGKCGIMAIR